MRNTIWASEQLWPEWRLVVKRSLSWISGRGQACCPWWQWLLGRTFAMLWRYWWTSVERSLDTEMHPQFHILEFYFCLHFFWNLYDVFIGKFVPLIPLIVQVLPRLKFFLNICDTEQIPPYVFTDGPEAWIWFGLPSILDRSWTKFPGTEIELYFCIAL